MPTQNWSQFAPPLPSLYLSLSLSLFLLKRSRVDVMCICNNISCAYDSSFKHVSSHAHLNSNLSSHILTLISISPSLSHYISLCFSLSLSSLSPLPHCAHIQIVWRERGAASTQSIFELIEHRQIVAGLRSLTMSSSTGVPREKELDRGRETERRTRQR
eukprot:sb/3472945/